jgi:hypothetical protein
VKEVLCQVLWDMADGKDVKRWSFQSQLGAPPPRGGVLSGEPLLLRRCAPEDPALRSTSSGSHVTFIDFFSLSTQLTQKRSDFTPIRRVAFGSALQQMKWPADESITARVWCLHLRVGVVRQIKLVLGATDEQGLRLD